MDTYKIKDNYKINKLNITNDKISQGTYWDKNRILAAEVFQFPVYEFLSGYIKDNNINNLIDIGCGVGRKLLYIKNQNPNINIIGIDQPDPIEYCKKNYDFGTWLSDDFEQPMPLKVDKSELIVCSDVIEHLINPDLLLEYIKTKLKPDGLVVLSTPERDSLRGKNCDHSPNLQHIREWNFNEFSEYLTSKGFEIIDHFLQYPIKMKLNKIFYREIIKRAVRLKPLKYNQVVLAKIK